MDFRIHWLSLTIWRNLEYALALWDVWFNEHLGEMQSTGHGGRGFNKIFTALAASRLYADPPRGKEAEKKREYFHIELPGQACDALPPYLIGQFLMDLSRHEEFKVKRIDLAWDNVPFTPSDVKATIDANLVRSLVKRSTLVFTDSPYEEREDGTMGTSSCQLGSRQSARMIRVYDKRGPTRLEFQARDKRAHLIALSLAPKHDKFWPNIARGHIRDYIDFVDMETGAFVDWWGDFIKEAARTNQTITNARKTEINSMVAWVNNQVSPTLSVIEDVFGSETIKEFIEEGRRKRGNRFKSILELKNKGVMDAKI